MSAPSTEELHAIVTAIEQVTERALASMRERFLKPNGKPDGDLLNQHQLPVHGLAYLATELEACRQLARWSGDESEHERRIAGAYIGEFARSLFSAIDLGTGETVALTELGLSDAFVFETLRDTRAFADRFASAQAFVDLAHESATKGFGALGLKDDTLDDVRREFARFVNKDVLPIAQDVHLSDVLIPMDLLNKMSELGVFGLTIPEEYGGLGMTKVAMCVVTEELSRGYIGVGSLGTRAEIAAELILGGGTEAQKQKWLPLIAAGEVLPTAVFTEPNTGSDLAHLGTRAVKQESGDYTIHGQKTWITHAVRADLMTLLARTNSDEPGYRGLSMFLAEKTRLDPAPGEPEFVDEGLEGTEIGVLGYRGMKEYELSFDGFRVSGDALLGGQEGSGFKQLMKTFESARIQTAARGVGVAQAALEDALRYAQERVQFAKPILEFPRVARKIGRMITRIAASRQLTYFSARRKDEDERCDLEAGMAKLLATRAAWEAADQNVQIHGGNGYALEYLASRLLVDSRVLSIFEGANEIQAHVVARRLLVS